MNRLVNEHRHYITLHYIIPQTDLSVGVLTALVEGNDWFGSAGELVFNDSYTVLATFGNLPGSCRGAAREP